MTAPATDPAFCDPIELFIGCGSLLNEADRAANISLAIAEMLIRAEVDLGMPLDSRKFLNTILAFWGRSLIRLEFEEVRKFEIDAVGLELAGYVGGDGLQADFETLARFLPVVMPMGSFGPYEIDLTPLLPVDDIGLHFAFRIDWERRLVESYQICCDLAVREIELALNVEQRLDLGDVVVRHIEQAFADWQEQHQAFLNGSFDWEANSISAAAEAFWALRELHDRVMALFLFEDHSAVDLDKQASETREARRQGLRVEALVPKAELVKRWNLMRKVTGARA